MKNLLIRLFISYYIYLPKNSKWLYIMLWFELSKVWHILDQFEGINFKLIYLLSWFSYFNVSLVFGISNLLFPVPALAVTLPSSIQVSISYIYQSWKSQSWKTLTVATSITFYFTNWIKRFHYISIAL